MENVLDVYHRPYDAARPVVCMDETPRQLIRQTRESYADYLDKNQKLSRILQLVEKI